MRLINNDGLVLVEFNPETTVFHSEILEREMKFQGVIIPEFYKKKFHGRRFVKLDDPQFRQAFKEVYCIFSLKNNHQYKWKD